MSYPIVFDVETKKSFREVNNDTKKLGVSVVAAYDYADNQIYAFLENELSGLFNLFEKASVFQHATKTKRLAQAFKIKLP